MLEDCEKSLYHGCSSYTKMSFIVKLLHLKALYKVSNMLVDELLHMFHKVLSAENTIPKSYYESNKYLSMVSLDYQKIHACKNYCILFTNVYTNCKVCPTCGDSMWILRTDHAKGRDIPTKSKRNAQQIPIKVFCYFSKTSRLQKYSM